MAQAAGHQGVKLSIQAAANYGTYEALAAPHPARTTALRRRLQWLSVRLLWHRYWSGPGRRPTARANSRHQVRTWQEQQ
ncbi:hypothetical protein ACFY2M_38445 [Streptomyces sp. NPDC001276]|uniref:hypothetical protein n=1 Tax=Streptomyces sp. NPDC001276 TaxID=3364555 RepID=UPI0036855347